MRVDWFLYHVASGHAFFSGLCLIVCAVLLAAVRKSHLRRAATVLLLAGTLLVAISATPLPWFVYAVAAVAVAVGLYAELHHDRLSRRRLIVARSTAIAAIVVTVAWELPYHLPARLEPRTDASLAVIGDSVTAGIGEDEAVTWPRLIASRHSIEVHDLSAMGATVASARKQADRLRPDDTIVVVEIGGNDLLGETSVPDFSTGLEALLQQVCRPGRTVVMFELPLPPTFNAYGRIQRQLAARHGVVLIPKRVLMGVLTDRDATLDTIHLSQCGHERLAEAVWDVVGRAYEK